MAEKKVSPLLPRKHDWKTLKPDPTKRDKRLVGKDLLDRDTSPYDVGYSAAMADNIDKSDVRDTVLGNPVIKLLSDLPPEVNEYTRGREAARKDLGYKYAKGGSVRGAGCAQRGVKKCKVR